MIPEGTWFNFSLDGSDISIRLKIRPLTPEKYIEITEKFAIRQKKKTYKTKSLAWRNSTEETIIDYLLENFSDIGMTQDQPLEVNVENKMKVVQLAYTCENQTIISFIFEQACILGGFPKVNIPGNEASLIFLLNKKNKRKK
jgi:hypothetical protein